jgi:hypothetical protein
MWRILHRALPVDKKFGNQHLTCSFCPPRTEATWEHCFLTCDYALQSWALLITGIQEMLPDASFKFNLHEALRLLPKIHSAAHTRKAVASLIRGLVVSTFVFRWRQITTHRLDPTLAHSMELDEALLSACLAAQFTSLKRSLHILSFPGCGTDIPPAFR